MNRRLNLDIPQNNYKFLQWLAFLGAVYPPWSDGIKIDGTKLTEPNATKNARPELNLGRTETKPVTISDAGIFFSDCHHGCALNGWNIWILKSLLVAGGRSWDVATITKCWGGAGTSLLSGMVNRPCQVHLERGASHDMHVLGWATQDGRRRMAGICTSVGATQSIRQNT
jgi:hypothetical protein